MVKTKMDSMVRSRNFRMYFDNPLVFKSMRSFLGWRNLDSQKKNKMIRSEIDKNYMEQLAARQRRN